MANRQLDSFLRHLRTLLRDDGGVTDAQLLESFIARKDPAAFARLVRRHGPMVWGVCRRVLNHLPDAEDAFQATFLVLLRKASSVVPRAMVGNWLYGVAYRTAMKARSASSKRRTKERQVEAVPNQQAAQQELWHDLQTLLDQELDRLPDKYRAAIVLCDLEGKTHKEAARLLAWPVGTLSTRLVRGRAMLAKRLTRRGLPVSGGSLAAVLAGNAASASVPMAVLSSTIKAASTFAAGQPAATASISVHVIALMEGVVRAMLLTKLKAAVLMLLTICGVAAFAGGFLRDTTEALAQATADSSGTKKTERRAPSTKVAELKDISKPPATAAEKAVGRLVLVFFDDQARRAVSGLTVGAGNDTLFVTASSACVVPDGIPPAIDRAFLEMPGKPAVEATYDRHSTPELFIYRVPGVVSAFEVNAFAPVSVGDRLSVVRPNHKGELRVMPNAAVVSALNCTSQVNLNNGKVLSFRDLIEVDRKLPEGTPLMLKGQLVGITVIGTRFVRQGADVSFAVPAATIQTLCRMAQ
jgi:RNA polymerase sigma factor (sigma-70 family)